MDHAFGSGEYPKPERIERPKDLDADAAHEPRTELGRIARKYACYAKQLEQSDWFHRNRVLELKAQIEKAKKESDDSQVALCAHSHPTVPRQYVEEAFDRLKSILRGEE